MSKELPYAKGYKTLSHTKKEATYGPSTFRGVDKGRQRTGSFPPRRLPVQKQTFESKLEDYNVRSWSSGIAVFPHKITGNRWMRRVACSWQESQKEVVTRGRAGFSDVGGKSFLGREVLVVQTQARVVSRGQMWKCGVTACVNRCGLDWTNRLIEPNGLNLAKCVFVTPPRPLFSNFRILYTVK